MLWKCYTVHPYRRVDYIFTNRVELTSFCDRASLILWYPEQCKESTGSLRKTKWTRSRACFQYKQAAKAGRFHFRLPLTSCRALLRRGSNKSCRSGKLLGLACVQFPIVWNRLSLSLFPIRHSHRPHLDFSGHLNG